ncbi:MAG TPA: carboxymuconolactone decarboxylase family protein [Candidatus Binatia bacterium]|nr:carboxymuconolactone decarboxylase family protein [Candidatus Binatia bacterium]
MADMQPLPTDAHPELAETSATFERILGFVPNSLLTMQRLPRIVEGFEALTRAVMDPAGQVDAGFKRLLAHVASRSAGCQYCQAHSLVAAGLRGVTEERLAALWDFPTSPLYTEAERAALDFALAAGAVPNAVNAAHFARLRQHWTDDQIVEMLAAVCLYGFLNRWNDTMATELESRPREVGERYLGRIGWDGGKHVAG